MRFAADENGNNDILRGVLRRYPELDVVRIQDTEVYEAEDPVVLEWVATAGRILLTHDTRTMPDFAYARVREASCFPACLSSTIRRRWDRSLMIYTRYSAPVMRVNGRIESPISPFNDCRLPIQTNLK
jgi:hypothetical protein